MPSKSEPQHNAMEAAKHGDSTIGIPQSVGAEFADADEAAGKYGSRDNYRGGEGGAFKRRMGQAKYNKAHFGSNTEPSSKEHPATERY